MRSSKAARQPYTVLAHARRRAADEITVYKAMGHVLEDIVAAELVYARATATGAGTTITL